MVSDRGFRSDLYYRLNVFPITSPSLRERPEDIPELVQHFTRKFATRMKKRIEGIPGDAMTALVRDDWPGNVRELENIIERAVILSRGSELEVPRADLTHRISTKAADLPVPRTTLEEAEREHIRQSLHQAHWHVGGPSGAAARLGVKRTTLQAKMAKLGIERPGRGDPALYW